MARRWKGKVLIRDREKWLAPVFVTVNGHTIFTANNAAAKEARKKIAMGKRRIYEMTVNVKPEATLDDREA